MTDTVEVNQPRCYDNGHIASEIVRNLRISQHPPTDQGVERKERQRSCSDDDHQHYNSLLPDPQSVRTDLHHVGFAKASIAVLSAVLQFRLDPPDGHGVENYHKRQRSETKNDCLNNNKYFPSVRRWPLLDAQRNSLECSYSSVVQIHRSIDDGNDPRAKDQVTDFCSLGTHFKRKVNHKELLHADDQEGHNGGINGSVLQKVNKFATDHTEDPPFRDKRVDRENWNTEYCDKDIRQAKTEHRKVRRAPSKSSMANNCEKQDAVPHQRRNKNRGEEHNNGHSFTNCKLAFHPKTRRAGVGDICSIHCKAVKSQQQTGETLEKK